MNRNQSPTRRPTPSIRTLATGLLLTLCGTGAVWAQTLPAECGSLSRPWGPFDYRADHYVREATYGSHKALIDLVENAHFTPEVEALIRGKTSAPPAGDIGYTLGVFPNHHRALIAMINLGERTKTSQPPMSRYTIECWILRAIAWRPDDPIVRMIYANFLTRSNRPDEAIPQLQYTAEIAKESPFTLNNIGMLYFDLKRYDDALSFAHQAMKLGFNPVQLRTKLTKVGKWADPPEDAPTEVAAAASAASAPVASASAPAASEPTAR